MKAAEHISVAGEIVVSFTAWHYVNPNEYLYEEVGDGLHVKVHGLGPNWRNTQKNIRYQKSGVDDEDDLEFRSNDTVSETGSTIISMDEVSDVKAQNNEDFLCRYLTHGVLSNLDQSKFSATCRERGCQVGAERGPEEVHHRSCDERHRPG